MDFDFDDISGDSQEKSVKKPPTKESITLTIPVQGGFISRDITECTTEEFLTWAQAVYPLIDEDNLVPSDFDRVDQRIRAMKQIETFHTQLLFAGKKNEAFAH